MTTSTPKKSAEPHSNKPSGTTENKSPEKQKNSDKKMGKVAHAVGGAGGEISDRIATANMDEEELPRYENRKDQIKNTGSGKVLYKGFEVGEKTGKAMQTIGKATGQPELVVVGAKVEETVSMSKSAADSCLNSVAAHITKCETISNGEQAAKQKQYEGYEYSLGLMSKYCCDDIQKNGTTKEDALNKAKKQLLAIHPEYAQYGEATDKLLKIMLDAEFKKREKQQASNLAQSSSNPLVDPQDIGSSIAEKKQQRASMSGVATAENSTAPKKPTA